MKYYCEINLYFFKENINIQRYKEIIKTFSRLSFTKIGLSEDNLFDIKNISDERLSDFKNDSMIITKNKSDEFISLQFRNDLEIGCLSGNIRLAKHEIVENFMNFCELMNNKIIFGQLDLESIIEDRHWQINKDKNGVITEEAVGNSLSEDGLPGMCFLNYFGEDYVALIGKEKLLSCSALNVEKAFGILVQSRNDISIRGKAEEDVEKRLISFLGDQYFWQPPNKKAIKLLGQYSSLKGELVSTRTKLNVSDELSNEMDKIADEAIQIAKESLEIELDYSENSVLKIDKIIDQFFSKREVDIEKISTSFGSLLGTIVKKNIGGKWSYYNFEGQELVALVDVGVCKSVIFPMNKVAKRIKNGKSDDLVFYYETLKK